MKLITPFSNGTQYMIWHNNNCAKCCMYESESTIRSKAKCKAAFDLDIALIGTGEISLKSANYIGLNTNRTIGNLSILKHKCDMLNIEFKKVKLNLEVFKQYSLF